MTPQELLQRIRKGGWDLSIDDLGVFHPHHTPLPDDLASAVRTCKSALVALLRAERAAKWDPPVPFDEFTVPAFPTDIFPRWQRTFVEAESTATQTPPDLPASLVIASTAAALARRFVVQIRSGYIEPVNCYTAAVLAPANRRTQVAADVISPVDAFEAELVREQLPTIRKRRAEFEILDGAFKKAKAAAAAEEDKEKRRAFIAKAQAIGDELAALHVRAEPKLLVDDVTPEKLGALLAEQGGRIAALSSEADIVDVMAGRYSKDNRPNLTVFLKAHAGDPLRVDRIGRPAVHVPHPALTLGLAIQPDVLHGVIGRPGFRGRGLLGRFLYHWPRSLLGTREIDPAPVPDVVRKRYHRGMWRLLELSRSPDADDPLAYDPHVLTMAPDAYKCLMDFAQWIEPQLADSGALGFMRDWGGKIAGGVARLAGQLHVGDYIERHLADSRDPPSLMITKSAAERACRVGGEYYVPHAVAAYGLMGADPALEHARGVLAWLKEHHDGGKCSKRTIWQGLRRRVRQFQRPHELDAPLAVLVERNFLREQPASERRGAGRKSSPLYEINPALLNSDSTPQNTQNPQNSGEDADDVPF
jgi:hypothetical protein